MADGEIKTESPWRIIRRRMNPLNEISVRTQYLTRGNQYPRRKLTEYRIIEELGPSQIRSSWIALDRCDGKQRLYRCLPSFMSIQSHPLYRRGRLVTSFTRYKLLRIAWKIGVSNPDGFGRDDCDFFGLNNQEGFQQFILGWKGINKITLGDYIWNYLYDNDAVYSCF
jgi:hypothetical protein